MAMFHDWKPERAESTPPTASWDTEIVMPYVSTYLSGTVSNVDAAGLAPSLDRLLASEGSGLLPELYFGALALRAVAQAGAFEVDPEETAG